MRTRTKHTVLGTKSWGGVTNAAFYRHNCSGDPITPGTYSSSGYGMMETSYEDSYIDDVSSASRKAKPVFHQSKRVEIDTTDNSTDLPLADGSGGWVHYDGYGPIWTPSNAYWLGPASGWIPGSQDLPAGFTESGVVNESRLIEDVYEKARGLKADVLLNIVEAHQIEPSIRSLTDCLPEMAQNWKKIRKLIRTASGSFLAWKFGVSPLLSDFMSIDRYTKQINEDLKRHRDGKPTRSSASASSKFVYSGGEQVLNSYFGYPADVRISTGDIVTHPTVRYVMVTRPVIKYNTEIFSGLDLLAHRFASSPASFAWEKVPFSFVVDWFVDLRGTMRRIDDALGFKPFEVVSFTRSRKWECSVEVRHRYLETCNGGTISDTRVGSCVYKSYERSVLASGPTGPRSQARFGKNQLAISAALIAQSLTKIGSKR